MVRIELADHEVPIVREFLEAELHDLYREIHHTDARQFREQLKEKQATIERMLGQLVSQQGSERR